MTMNRYFVEGVGVLNGEVEWTNVTFADTLEEALQDSRIAYERSHGKLAGTQIGLRGKEQEEWTGPEFK